MGIVIRKGDYSIEVGTEADLRTALRVLEERQLALPLSGQPLQGRPTTDSLRRFYHSIQRDRGKEFLIALAASEHGLGDGELRLRLGISSNLELAGTIAGLSRLAGKNHIAFTEIVTKTTIPRPPGRPRSQAHKAYRYELTSVMREVVLAEAGANKKSSAPVGAAALP